MLSNLLSSSITLMSYSPSCFDTLSDVGQQTKVGVTLLHGYYWEKRIEIICSIKNVN